MGLGRGVLLWLLGIPIPIILLLALFWHHYVASFLSVHRLYRRRETTISA
jgi:hypothetical protein